MSTTAIPIMYTPSRSISIWNASKPLLNYYDKLQVTIHIGYSASFAPQNQNPTTKRVSLK
jgi:low affinity Fe/Cu permease